MRRLTVAQAGVLAAVTLASTACGSTQKVDQTALTTTQRATAQTALDLLQNTPIPRAVVATSFQSGQAPTTCVLVPASDNQETFKLYLAWKPNRPDFMSTPQTVIEGTISSTSAKNDQFTTTSFGGGGRHPKPEPPKIEADLVRAVLAKPNATCEVLESGHLRLASPQ